MPVFKPMERGEAFRLSSFLEPATEEEAMLWQFEQAIIAETLAEDPDERDATKEREREW